MCVCVCVCVSACVRVCLRAFVHVYQIMSICAAGSIIYMRACVRACVRESACGIHKSLILVDLVSLVTY